MEPLDAEKCALLPPVSAPERPLDRRTSITRTIRAKCLSCSGGSTREVRLCPDASCPLWPWRMGVSPKTLRRRQPELLDPEAVLQMREQAERPSRGTCR